ncbi:TonB-dependent receptor [Deminuibacter soli]|uniref:TonB-dependent receptor n=1 Tax=Deminuibacter soli TaxID=2291815 RepID=A0A3E1NLZ4_9BACT|nr:TonB-dependent receptor [Deminuibacter soli]RFM28956.1 TonB-dependent receptor [Deminuibacter soli]
MRQALLAGFVCISLSAAAQNTDSLHANNLDTVTVKAFSLQTQWKQAPAAVAIINEQQLQRNDRVSLVPVFNTITGVRMEERSPGSYRLSLRGSLLRSPFGVRNVKIYWDDIPLTDGGGNTYLQLIDINQLQSVEIVKGPASSMYGANTGGAVLLHSGSANAPKGSSWQAGVGGGSYGLFNEQIGYTQQSDKLQLQVKQTHMQSDGYRQQTGLRRDAGQVNGRWQLSKGESLSFMGFYTDLYYGTPGGITQQQMDLNPKLARQPGNGLPGAQTQQAAVYNKTAFGGITLHSALSQHWSNISTITVNHTGFNNAAIANYEQRDEWNYGGRTSFQYGWQTRGVQWQALAGAEWQLNHSHVDDYGNRAGVKDTVQFKDVLNAIQSYQFAQVQAVIGSKWHVQAGVSRNDQRYNFRRPTDPAQQQEQKKTAGPLWAPRFSVLYEVSNGVAVYGITAKGFSPPTVAEIRPSDGNYYGNLQPEYGWNEELGVKGFLFGNRLQYDIAYYHFALTHAIVTRKNDAGAEYFVNAGGTSQNGVEAALRGVIIRGSKHFITELALFNSYSFQPYSFSDYKSGGADFSGNRVTGVPRNINVSGIDIATKPGFYLHGSFNYTGSIPLTDANDAWAKPYHLLQAKLGWHTVMHKTNVDIYAGADNLLNETYSLGNDLNAAGKRYYNPAPKRNVYAGIVVGF